MNSTSPSWESQSNALWMSIDEHEPAAFVALVEAHAALLPPDSPVALFERACAQDSTGHSDLAEPLYRQALERGLSGLRRRRATIQLASSLRNLGQAAEAAELLAVELEHPHDELTAAAQGFLALALADLGREREALALSLSALSTYLPRYNKSLARYAAELAPASGRAANAP